jgi:glycosyltransferase involved in cell wall biosynthesis
LRINNLKSEQRNIVFIVNTLEYLISHRREILESLVLSSWKISIICFKNSPNKNSKIFLKNNNIDFLYIKDDINYFSRIIKLVYFLKTRENFLLHCVGVESCFWGSLMSFIQKPQHIFYAISGLGSLFIKNSANLRAQRIIFLLAMRVSVDLNDFTFLFHNNDDRKLIGDRIPKSKNAAVTLPGSGVNLEKFHPVPISWEKPVILMPARLIRDKGVIEFVDAASALHNAGLECDFVIAGDIFLKNPSHLTEAEIEHLKATTPVKFLGAVSDMPTLYQKCCVVCLPSYREGLPKVLLEAGASGRAVITTNVPGCRDAIISGKTGLLVEKGNSSDLAAAIFSLVENRNLCEQLGKNGRKLAEERFSVENIVNAHHKLYAMTAYESCGDIL